MSDLTGRGVRVLVIATENHHGPGLPAVPAVGRTSAALVDRLTGRCGVARSQLTVLHDAPDAFTIARAISEATQQAETVLLIWYVGHGLRGRDGELYLAAAGTDRLTPGLAAHQAYRVSDLRQALSVCRASSIVVVLDCCFSARAQLDAPVPATVAEPPPVHGVYLLSSAEQLALADPDAAYTAFTGEFLTFLDRGDPDAGRALTLDDAYHHLFTALRVAGAPLPRRQEAGHAGRLVLAANPAWQPPGRSGGAPVAQSTGPSPYRGLEPFEERHADVFFGREAVCATLHAQAAQRLADPVPLLVIGPSGVGKTSLVHAGLLPAARRDGWGDDASARVWPVPLRPFTPGPDPLSSLARVLGDDRPDAGSRLAERPAAAVELLDRGTGGGPERPALLVVDQFEELFTLGSTDDTRRGFMACLSALAAPRPGGGPWAVVVVVLRADFYGAASAEPALAGLVAGPRVVVGPMTGAELRSAVREPAARAGLDLDEGLAELILHELGADGPRGPEPGALPLLSHVLWETWRRRRGSRLDLAAYRESGGLDGAIAKTAEETYAGFTPAQQEIVRRLLLRLTRVGADGVDTARPVARADLLDGLDGDAVVVVERLAARRLLGIEADGDVRISHEILLRAWPRLRSWLNDDRGRLVAGEQLTDAAALWRSGGRRRGDLLAGSRLMVVRKTLAATGVSELGPVERDFLDRSLRRRRTGRLAAALLAVLVLVLGTGGVVAVQQRARAERLDAELGSRLIAAQANAMRATQPEQALALATTAWRTSPTEQARQALYAAAAAPLPVALTGHDGHVYNLAYFADGKVLASSSTDRTVRLWHVGDHRHPLPGAVISLPNVTPIATSAQGRYLFGWSAGQLLVWHVLDPARPFQVAAVPTGPESLRTIGVSPDGSVLATGDVAGVVQLWDIAQPWRPRPLAELKVDPTDVWAVAFDRRGGVLVTSSRKPPQETEDTIRLWDVADPRQPTKLSELRTPTALAVALGATFTESLLVAGGGLGTLNGWDITDPARPREIGGTIDGPADADGIVWSLAFQPGEQTSALFVSGHATGGIDVIEVDPRAGPTWRTRLGGAEPSSAVAFRPDGIGLAQGTEAGGIRLWARPLSLLPYGLSNQGVNDVDSVFDAFDGTGRIMAADLTELTDLLPKHGSVFWELGGPAPRMRATLPRGWSGAAFLPGGRIAIARNAEVLQLWEVPEGRSPIAGDALPVPPGRETIVVPGPDGRQLVAGSSRDRELRVLAVRDQGRIDELARVMLPEPARKVRYLGPDLLAAWGARDIHLWDLRDGAAPRAAGVLGGSANALSAPSTVTYLPERRVALVVASVDQEPQVQLWDLADPHEPRRAGLLEADSHLAEVVVLGVDRVAVGTSRGLVAWDLTDVDDPAPAPALSGEDRLRADGGGYLLSPDGQLMVVAGYGESEGPTATVWRRAAPGQGLYAHPVTLYGTSPRFSPDGRYLVLEVRASSPWKPFLSNDGVLVVDLDPESLHQRYCAGSPEAFDRGEWQRYLPTVPYRTACG
ncbi:AAA family ATPase [Micromonospora sp. WMMD1082]|uniref:caspase, EACC1-associated type n=1 Tax=Micromonospora sp. WMMD1082 TaxID=3016104 RepID=UPI002417B0BE|nr:AAA family ATPase [Micromonospora sp. WMMD1082]MDG4792466.1 caspase family protein [Micromonospora sp. WMMD1082]